MPAAYDRYGSDSALPTRCVVCADTLPPWDGGGGQGACVVWGGADGVRPGVPQVAERAVRAGASGYANRESVPEPPLPDVLRSYAGRHSTSSQGTSRGRVLRNAPHTLLASVTRLIPATAPSRSTWRCATRPSLTPCPLRLCPAPPLRHLAPVTRSSCTLRPLPLPHGPAVFISHPSVRTSWSLWMVWYSRIISRQPGSSKPAGAAAGPTGVLSDGTRGSVRRSNSSRAYTSLMQHTWPCSRSYESAHEPIYAGMRGPLRITQRR